MSDSSALNSIPQASLNSLPSGLPPSMLESIQLLPKNARLVLFTRHSLREPSDKNGFASFNLPLTVEGRHLAKAWGQWLCKHLDYDLQVHSLSSPIARCVDTALLMQLGAGVPPQIIQQPLLVEPGSLVTDITQVNDLFRRVGALAFINLFLKGNLAGTKSPEQGILDLLQLFYQYQPKQGQIMVAVSHDTLLSAFLAVLMGVPQISWTDWADMMEGTFLWFDAPCFEQSCVNFIWRGKQYQRAVAEILAKT